jgi:hypothetical protein
MEFTEEQKTVLDTNASMRILAAAGSGKTTTLAHYVKKKLTSFSMNSKEICFITFTRFAAEEIKKKVRAILKRSTQMVTGTFHATMFKMMKMANIPPLHTEFLYDDRMEESVNYFMNHLENGHPGLVTVLQSFKLLVVDEFQDLDHKQFMFVKYFKQYNPDLQVVAIGDLAQNIYRFRGTSNEFLRTLLQREVIPDLVSLNLTTNFRSSQSILNFINVLFQPEIKEGHILPMIAPTGCPLGIKPKYFEFAVNPGKGMGEYEEKVANEVIHLISRAKNTGKSLVLIFPIIKCSSFQLVTALLRQYSKNHGFAFDLHQIAKEDETATTVAFEYDPRKRTSPIQFSSFHASKGLEWDIVAIINFTDSLFAVRDGEEDNEFHYAEKTNLCYVGLTRPIEELYIFANANFGGRNRLIVRHGEAISDVLDIIHWGEEVKEPSEFSLKPTGVKELLRKLQLYPDLFERMRKASENIAHHSHVGFPMINESFYSAMKLRNRELSFGTYIDWKTKQMLCIGKSKTFQDLLLELVRVLNEIRWKTNRRDGLEDISMRRAKLDVIFMNSETQPNAEIDQYISASRWLGAHQTKYYISVPAIQSVYREIEKLILTTNTKEKKTATDEYILSQALNFYVYQHMNEIQAIDAPENSYQGFPEGFDEFVNANLDMIPHSVLHFLGACGVSNERLVGDYCLETKSLILGEADLWTPDNEGVLVELKVSSSIQPKDLRDPGNCKNLLQVLAYAAMGRHGVIPMPCRWAGLVNPLTGTWERYDLSTWSLEESTEFMACLEELRER